jgi:hypothetical protein
MTHEEYIQRLKDAPFHEEKIQELLGYIEQYPDLIEDSMKLSNAITLGNVGDTMEWVSRVVDRLEGQLGVILLTLIFLGTTQEIWDNFVAYAFLRTLKITEKNGITYVDATE